MVKKGHKVLDFSCKKLNAKKFCFIFEQKNRHIMKATTKDKNKEKMVSDTKKPDAPRKIVVGAGRHLAYISDTLFDEDLKR